MDEFVMRFANYLGLVAVLLAACLCSAQKQVGDNVHLNASGLFTGGYSGVYGNDIASSHGIDLGLNGSLNGDYFNPNFLSFVVTPYYNQSRADSSFQSLTGASGVAASANIFSGSHFPGSVSYHYDYNSTGTYGLEGVPNFTTQGTGQGFGVNWSLLFPNWPTLSVGYSQGSGSSTLYGTNEESSGHQRNLTLRSGYQIAGFLLNATFDHNTFNSLYPEFLVGQQESISDTSANDFGVNASHNLPLNGTFSTSYTHESVTSDYLLNSQQGPGASNSNNFTTQTQNAFANFHPTDRVGFSVSESFTDNLSGYLNQALINNGSAPVNVNLGTGSQSFTVGGGASYRLTKAMSFQATATHYEQYYLNQNYSGTYISGGINFNRKLWDMFTFSAFMVDSSNADNSNSIGFVGNVNYFHRFRGWETSGAFSYSQNAQTLLVSYTTSFYNYSARLRHRLPYGLMWIGSFNGSHSGFSQQQGTDNHSESYSTSLSGRWLTLTGLYTRGDGNSLISNGGLVPLPPTPGIPVSDLIVYQGSSYGGSLSSSPIRRLSISGSYNRAISNTIGATESHNNTEIFNAQVQYRLRRISLLSGWTRYSQGISAVTVGPPGVTSSFFVGVSRWFNFF